MNLEFRPAFEKFEVHNAGTRYIGYRWEPGINGEIFVALVTKNSLNAGEWIQIREDSISWDYLAEKMPAIEQYAGDKPGWVALFKEMDIEVFG